ERKMGHEKDSFLRNSDETHSEIEGKVQGVFPGVLSSAAAFRVEVTGTALVAAPPAGPGKHQDRTARRRPKEVGQQMTYFGNGKREGWTSHRHFLIRWR